ncbi:MAG: AAA family ATPase [Lachnospiraceae bacterium]|nr:AAA family ATPase [Lachnospiraceae bacterium]
MSTKPTQTSASTSRKAEEAYLQQTLAVVEDNLSHYGREVARMQEDIDEMLAHYHDNDAEVLTILNNTVTLHDHMKRALQRNEKAQNKPYFGRIIFHDESLDKTESLYIGKGGIAKDSTHQIVIDWRAPVAGVYYENGLGKCSYKAPGEAEIAIDLQLKRTYEIESGKLLDYFDSEVIANDDLLTKYLAKNKQAVLSEIVATIQKEQNEIIRKSPYHNIIVQGVAGSGKTTVAMHRISYILYNYEDRFRPDDFYIVGSNRILLDYITGVLPDLDVYGVRQMTMEELFVRLLYEDWDKEKYTIRSVNRTVPSAASSSGSADSGADESIKGSACWFQALEGYCRRLEERTISCKSVYLNPKQFVEGLQDGKFGVFDTTGGQTDPRDLVCLLEGEAVERYLRQNPTVSIQSKINMLNDRLRNKIKEEFLGKGIKYTEPEKKAILKAYRRHYGANVWKKSIYDLYHDFLVKQNADGAMVTIPDTAFDVYDLAALAYLYKRVKETEVISEAHHIVIDEAQDFGMMAYHVLHACIRGCTYTVMGDVSQNIHFGYGLNDWEALRELLLPDPSDTFGLLKKSYRNTVEISDFATRILRHGRFFVYPVEPVLRHGSPVQTRQLPDRPALIRTVADTCQGWRQKGWDTIAVICRSLDAAAKTAGELSAWLEGIESDPEKAVFGNGIMVLPVDYTKGLEFDAVLLLDPTREDYPVEDGHAKLLYVATTRALHELCILHTGNLTGLITDPVPEHTLPADKAPAVNNPIPSAAPAGTAHTNPRKSDRARPKTADTIRASHALPSEQRKSGRSPQRHAAHAPDGQNPALPKPENNTPVMQETFPEFGDMPATEILRPAGHGKIDLAVRWSAKQPDGLYLHSRYGVLRLSPVGSAIVRVTFAKSGQIEDRFHPAIAVRRTERTWMYKESAATIDLMTDELLVQTDKASGAIRFMTRDKKLLFAERNKECRQLEGAAGGRMKVWLYPDWPKNETIYAMGAGETRGMNIRKTARYISHSRPASNNPSSQCIAFGQETPAAGSAAPLPILLSERGYGIVLAADSPVICCDLPTYGTYLYAKSEVQMDYYFIAGKRPNTILNACAYLCGRL